MEEYQEIQENIYDEIHIVKENHAKSNENKFPLYGTEVTYKRYQSLVLHRNLTFSTNEH